MLPASHHSPALPDAITPPLLAGVSTTAASASVSNTALNPLPSTASSAAGAAAARQGASVLRSTPAEIGALAGRSVDSSVATAIDVHYLDGGAGGIARSVVERELEVATAPAPPAPASLWSLGSRRIPVDSPFKLFIGGVGGFTTEEQLHA